MSKLKKGDQAPQFSLKDQDENVVELDRFRGQKMLLYFYPRANTPGCTKQSCAVSEALGDFKKLKVAAVGMSPDSPEKQKKFDEKYSLGFPLLADIDGKTAKSYGAWGIKTSFGKKREGLIRSAFLIDEDGKILEAWYAVKPDETVPRAIAALRASD